MFAIRFIHLDVRFLGLLFLLLHVLNDTVVSRVVSLEFLLLALIVEITPVWILAYIFSAGSTYAADVIFIE